MSNEPTSEDKHQQDVSKRFQDALDRHGYSFQYTVLRKINEIFAREDVFRECRWFFETAEFPVMTGGFDTRIDFTLREQRGRFILVAECKRADPALGEWCFVRAPYVRRNRNSHEKLFLDRLEIRVFDSGCEATSYGIEIGSIDAYHIGFDVRKVGEKGDSGGGGRKAIEEAAGQVCKGVNGLLTTMAKHAPVDRTENRTIVADVLGVIFTTAKLWVAETDIGTADINTGRLPDNSVTVKPVPWLYLQYPLSPALKHGLKISHPGNNLYEILDPLYTRTIAVVNSEGIEQFFRQFDPYF